MHVIFGNYGDNTIAVMQWCYQKKLDDVYVVNVNTGWAAPIWHERVSQGQQLARQFQFSPVILEATPFAHLIQDRESFPASKYQWCPTFLKAIPFLEWLDQHDPDCIATIILGSSRCDSRQRQALLERQDMSEYYGERQVWYPLYDLKLDEKQQLITGTGIPVLNQRSQECSPCIHSNLAEIANLDDAKVATIINLEQVTKQRMFPEYLGKDILTLVNEGRERQAKHETAVETRDIGCGSHYVCGE